MRTTHLAFFIAALAGSVLALPTAISAAEISRPRSPAPNVVKHNYGREADAEFDRPRSPAPNVVKHNYNEN
ncbi:hypothetical protein K505DRAFT_368628 [Melanomma pulvis-pyrius CBS 109.77]|uniref:Uncharacterized protein n=1 Tax=Melanomma pulvis-pyrius CBS 109.77 TaxID=1314802 RepID=A0A6A6WQ49_9PLEO|nr:hypothetical protein K505DRAFT_368628 [Melanomma pulvis-pyrius CBS 109.77]